jgi:hypothetical protein
MAVIKLTKSSNGLKTWKRLASDIKRREKTEFCPFYTPMKKFIDVLIYLFKTIKDSIKKFSVWSKIST